MKRIWILVLTLCLALTSVACGKKDEEETSREIFNHMLDDFIENQNFEVQGQVSLDLNLLTKYGIPSPLELNIEGERFSEDKARATLGLNLSLLPIEADLYFTNQELMIHSQVLGAFLGTGYLYLDKEEVMGDDRDLPSLQDLMTVYKNYVASDGYDFHKVFVLSSRVKKEEVEINGEDLDLRKITMTLDPDHLDDLLVDMVVFALEDASALRILNLYMTPDQVEEMRALLKDQDQVDGLLAYLDQVDFKDIEVEFYIDSSNRLMKVLADMDLKVDVNQESYHIQLELAMDFFNHSQVKDFSLPEVNPVDRENILDILDDFIN